MQIDKHVLGGGVRAGCRALSVRPLGSKLLPFCMSSLSVPETNNLNKTTDPRIVEAVLHVHGTLGNGRPRLRVLQEEGRRCGRWGAVSQSSGCPSGESYK